MFCMQFLFIFQNFNAFKHHWSDNRIPVILRVTPCSLDQVDRATNKVLCSYDYKDIDGLSEVNQNTNILSNLQQMPIINVLKIFLISLGFQVSDYPGGFVVVHGGFSRLVSFNNNNCCCKLDPFVPTKHFMLIMINK